MRISPTFLVVGVVLLVLLLFAVAAVVGILLVLRASKTSVQRQQQYGQPVNTLDIPSPGMNVLCFLIPVVGLILYLVWKDQTPVKAKDCGKFAIAGAITWVVLSILLSVFSALLPVIFYLLFELF